MHLFPVWCISPRPARELRIPRRRRRSGGPQADQTPRGGGRGRARSAPPARRGPGPALSSAPAPAEQGGRRGAAGRHQRAARRRRGGAADARGAGRARPRGGRRRRAATPGRGASAPGAKRSGAKGAAQPPASLPQTGGPGGRRKATHPERRRPRRRAGGERSEPRAGAGRREKPRHKAGAWVCRGKLSLVPLRGSRLRRGCSCAPAHRHSEQGRRAYASLSQFSTTAHAASQPCA